jgi:hypothetical protein
LFGHHHHRAAYAGYGYGYAAAPVCPPAYAPAIGYGAPTDVYAAPAACAPVTETYYGAGTITADGGYATGAAATQSLCEPVTGYRVVMEPQFVTETVAQPSTELQTETRYRVKTVNKTVPVKQQSYRVRTVIKPVTETKTVEYSVLVPETSEKSVDVTVSVPVWKETSEDYTIKVPQIVDVPEEYTVRVPTLRDEEFTYTVQVPQTQTVTKTQTVTNAVPVTKTRTVQRSVPVYSTKSVERDYGHWETVVDEVTAPAAVAAPVTDCNGGAYVANGCGAYVANNCGCAPAVNVGCGCGTVAAVNGCGSNLGYGSASAAYAAPSVACAPAVQTASRRVWVPNVVTEEVPTVETQLTTEEIAYTVYEQQTQEVPYECTSLVYRPEQRTGTRQVVDYNNETRTRNRKVVQYKDETRTRTRKVMNYETQTKTETYPYVSYRTDKRTKEVSFTIQVPEQIVEPYEETRYDQVSEQVVEEYTVQVSVPTTREAKVQVMRMVPKLVPYTYTPCCSSTTTGGYSVDGGAGNGAGYSVGGYDSGAVSGCGCSVAPAIVTPCCN